MTRTYYAPAKINLWLRVFAPDDTGYHPLDTLFCAIDLRDTLEIGPGKGIELRVTGADVGPVESNLAYRAAHEYFLAIGESANIALHLHKTIPAGAGLGGGSSDAAAVLRALQEQYRAALPQADLLALAARLGSDVPFFLCGSPWALGSGRGEVLEPVVPLAGRTVVVVKPHYAIGTRNAYEWLDDSGALPPRGAALPAPRNWSDVEKNAVNTFEDVLFQRHADLARLRDILHRAGARIALVSGSGSALFGVFDESQLANDAHRQLSASADVTSYLAKTLD